MPRVLAAIAFVAALAELMHELYWLTTLRSIDWEMATRFVVSPLAIVLVSIAVVASQRNPH